MRAAFLTTRPLTTSLLTIGLLALAACTAPPESAYVSGGGTATSVAIGRTAAGEECRLARSGAGGDVLCGEWSSPSARIRATEAAAPLEAAEAARAGLAARLDCAAPRPTTALGGQPAALMDCRRRAGGWPAFALTVRSGNRTWLAEGVLPAYAAAEQSIGVLGGSIRPDAAPLPSAALDAMIRRMAREAVTSGDIGRYEGLMQAGRDANQAERFVAAETAYRAALTLQERALGGNAPDTFQPMALLALQLSNQGRYPEAEVLFARAAALAPRAADPLATAAIAHYRGLHEANRGRADPALALLSQAGGAYARYAPPPTPGAPAVVTDPIASRALIGLIETRRNSAAILRAAGRAAEAEAASAEAARLARSAAGSDADIILARVSRTGGSIAAGGGGNLAAADRAYATAADRFARGVPRSRPLADTLLLRAASLSPAAAAGPCRDAVAILTNLREGTSPARIAPCVDAFAAAGTPEGLADAFGAAQLAQGNVTAVQIARAAARLAAGARDPAVAEALRRREAADRDLSARYRERDEAAADGRPLDALNARIAEAETAAAEADAAAQSAAPGYAQLVASVSPARDVMAALAPGEAMVLTTLPPDRRGWTFLLLDGQIHAGRVGADTPAVAAAVARLRASVESGAADKPFDAAAAYAVHAAIFSGVAEPLSRARALVAVPEGPLLSIPYGVLVTEAPSRPTGHEGASFLLARLPVAHVPAASSLVAIRRAGPSRAARPWFGFGDPRPVPQAVAARAFPAQPACGQALSSLAPLPASAIELAAAREVTGATTADLRLGPAFTASSVRNTRLSDYRVLHFATHGVLPSDLTCLTEPAIIATPLPDASGALVTAGTILDLDLDADLVVLSACNSGGGVAAGESLSTLARAFFFGGARGLLVTHWYVNDVAAARVAAFTLRNTRAGDPPAEALRRAQLDLLRVPGAGHPALWAPFALIGPGPSAPTRTATGARPRDERRGPPLSEAPDGRATALHLEHRPAPPWIAASAPTFRSAVECTGLLVAVPCYGGMVTAATLRGLLDTQRAALSLGLPVAVATTTNESLVPRARNALAAAFLASSASHLLFVDADIGFGADAVLRLLGHARPVAGGLYRAKTEAREEWVAAFPTGQGGRPEPARRDPRTGAVEVAALGTGFLLLHRSVLERLAEALPEIRYRTAGGAEGGHAHAFFEAGIEPGAAAGEGRYLSEDYLFCARWRALGGEVWCDPAILLEHHGQVRLSGDPASLFAPA
ncbi:CHAT domain-containing protein [Roseomonas sp. CCTCC AB2023176]|uniref:CHAT domain-containing protein n=1 Tax=Roseomonas sp. CCTCC AB2023176 TaxID=3342640 RepID=UPI0035E359E1